MAVGLLAACSGDDDDAVTATTAAPVAVAPTAASLLDEGIAAQVAGDTVLATAKFTEVIKMDPTSKLAHYNLGLIE